MEKESACLTGMAKSAQTSAIAMPQCTDAINMEKGFVYVTGTVKTVLRFAITVLQPTNVMNMD